MEQDGRTGLESEPLASGPLEISHFDRRVGEKFLIEAEIGSVVLTLAEVHELPHSPREGGGFRLEFRGAKEFILPQAIYAFVIDGDPHDIFIVPLGPEASGHVSYEAVFY